MSCFFLFIKILFGYPNALNLYPTKNFFLIIFVLSKYVLPLHRK